ncbi:branched-chain amino acid transport system II carrier protein [Enterococcus faecalis 13-SD-W-01]|nr:branched-chain amino acid transport system II carrier protein [Enterococcus faecalis 13-SD-W-01]
MKSLSTKKLLLLASLIFGMFFGAGNLIFPAMLGQLAGGNWLAAGGGFLLSSTLLPLAALIALSKTRSTGLYDFAKPVSAWYGVIFLIMNHMALGPLFATPRTAALGYQFSFGMFIPEKYTTISLLIFSAIFFGLAYYLSVKETNLLKIIGKWLNPLFLLLLFAVFIIALILPFGPLDHTPTNALYNHAATINGFLEGYNTMDALAALAFGITIIRTLQSMGIRDQSEISKNTIKSGALAMILSGGVYLGIIALGAMSLNRFSLADNGGIALTQIVQAYFGKPGLIFMSIMTFLAVFTSAMGLLASFAQDFSVRFTFFSYKGWLRITTILSFITANFGLDTIIAWTMPFLMILYPLAMALIIPALFSSFFKNDRIVYQITTIFVVLPALMDGIKALPIQSHFTLSLSSWYSHAIPFASMGLGWIVPAIVGLIVGLAGHFIFSRNKQLVGE